MRIEIETKQPIADKDIRALYIISYALSLVSDKMKLATV